MPPFRQRFPLDASAAEDDPFAAVRVKASSETSATPGTAEDDPFAAVRVTTQPVASVSSAPEESWLQKAGDVATGFAKGALHGLLDIGDLASRAGFIPGSTPALPNPTIEAARQATPYRTTAERVGGGIETATELAAPAMEAGKLGIAAARAVPELASRAGPVATELATHLPVIGRPIGLLRTVLKMSGKLAEGATSNAGGRLVEATSPSLEDELARALESLRAPTPAPSVELPPARTLPPGYQPRATVPAAATRRATPPSVKVAPSEIPSRVPFDVADPATLDRLPQEADLSKPTLQRVPLKDLVATQEGLSPEVVRGHLEHPPADLSKVPARAVGRFDPDAVTVIRGADGRNYLSGGTHRATAAFLRGDPDIQAIVYPSKPSAIPAAVAEKVPAAVRPYFLKSQAQMADEAAAQLAPRSTPSGSVDIADLPESWKSRTGQDVIPSTGALGKEVVKAFTQELKDQGLSVGQAIAAVSKNRALPLPVRTQLLKALMQARPSS